MSKEKEGKLVKIDDEWFKKLEEEIANRTPIQKVWIFLRYRLPRIITDAFYEVKYFFQRMFRRYDDRQVIDLDSGLMKDALLRIKDFRKHIHGLPCKYPYKDGKPNTYELDEWGNKLPIHFTIEEWEAIIDEMIWVVEELMKDDWWYTEKKDDYKYHRRIKRGKLLWLRHFDSLWL